MLRVRQKLHYPRNDSPGNNGALLSIAPNNRVLQRDHRIETFFQIVRIEIIDVSSRTFNVLSKI